MSVRAMAPPVLAVALFAAACASSGAGDGATTPGGSVTPGETPTQASAPPSAFPSTEASPLIEDGRNFAFIKSVDASSHPATVTYDLAYFLSGEEAIQAAKDHGDEVPPPNDYYIVNDNPKLRTVPLAPDASLVLLDWSQCCDQTFEGTLADFARSFDEGELTAGGHLYKGNLSPYWLVAEDGTIVRVEEQYLA